MIIITALNTREKCPPIKIPFFPIMHIVGVICFAVPVIIGSVLARLRDIPHLPSTAFHEDGDLNIGGIFTLSQFSSDSPCSDQLLGTVQMQFVEAMAFAVDRINRIPGLLPNVKLGFTILDDCSKDTTALAQALRFLPQCSQGTCTTAAESDGHCLSSFDVVAVVGAMASRNSMAAADILNQYHIPQISAVSTSDLLSDKKRYRYFMRMVSPDRVQVRTTVDFIAYFNWTYISVIASKGSYGSHGLKLIKERARDKNICIAYSTEIMDGMSSEEYDSIIYDLLQNKEKAKVIIMYAGVAAAQGVFRAAQRASAQGVFTWIISDAFSSPDSHKGIEDIVNQSFIVKMFAKHVQQFDNYFTRLTPRNNRRNPWFKKFWSKHFECSLSGGNNNTSCKDDLRMSAETGYQQDNRVSLFVDSITTIAIAIDRLIHENCPKVLHPGQQTHLKDCVTGPRLLEYLLETHFSGEVGNITFDRNGNMFGKYQVFQILYDVENGTRMSEVAEWCPVNGLFVYTDAISWQETTGVPPKSICSEPCGAGKVPVREEMTCCWSCRSCRVNEIVTSEMTDCWECPPNTWPNTSTFRTCHEIPPDYLQLQNPITLILLSLSCLGMGACCLVAVVFIKNKTVKIIKASSLEVSVVIGKGVFLAYVTVIAFLWPPSMASCTLSFLGFSISFTLLYAPLLIKTIRIYRIFRSAQYGNKRPQFIANKWQVLFSLSLICFQVSKNIIIWTEYIYI